MARRVFQPLTKWLRFHKRHWNKACLRFRPTIDRWKTSRVLSVLPTQTQQRQPRTRIPAANVNPNANQPAAATSPTVGAKREGVIRIGVVAVKPGNVAEGMNPQQLALAVQNTFIENLKATNIEAIPIEGTGGIQAEAQQKECDYLVFANVSHKKGGGGFGSFMNSAAGKVASNVGYGSGTAAVVATNAVVAATVAQNIKAKDEMTLDVRLERPGATSPTFAQQYKGKAKSAGEDIITPLVQQAAQAMLAAAK